MANESVATKSYPLYEARKKVGAFLRKIKFDHWKGWIYLSPAIVLLLIFTAWPIFNTVRFAFLEKYSSLADLNPDITFEFGLGNFQYVLEYQYFKDCLFNTIILCVLTVPISTFLALLIAVCLNSIKALSRFLQTIYFLPYVTNSIAIGMVFAAMFNIVGLNRADINASTSLGIVNNIIQFFGGTPINWINAGSGYWENIFVMVVYIVWNALPFKILILLGGLQSVNKQYYDAAKIDSTPKWRVFTNITVPLLSPMIAYVVITGFIGGFKEYSSIVGIFGDTMGPPGAKGRLNTMVGYIYDAINGSTKQYGRASAAAIILFLIIFAVTLVNLQVSKKKTHY
ncbi:MAG: sugar ABC transporter permease [Clostridia bacterium]|nr:sugar ABC transporter permease [Clostridia bacterium]MBR3876166.1 sugar ABC transporter permease [Clostridia bacterium]